MLKSDFLFFIIISKVASTEASYDFISQKRKHFPSAHIIFSIFYGKRRKQSILNSSIIIKSYNFACSHYSDFEASDRSLSVTRAEKKALRDDDDDNNRRDMAKNQFNTVKIRLIQFYTKKSIL
jgi:hypothetical protein